LASSSLDERREIRPCDEDGQRTSLASPDKDCGLRRLATSLRNHLARISFQNLSLSARDRAPTKIQLTSTFAQSDTGMETEWGTEWGWYPNLISDRGLAPYLNRLSTMIELPRQPVEGGRCISSYVFAMVSNYSHATSTR
jgi:hypothetical protein